MASGASEHLPAYGVDFNAAFVVDVVVVPSFPTKGGAIRSNGLGGEMNMQKGKGLVQKGLIPTIAGVLAVGAATSMVIKRRAVKKAALAARSKVTELVASRPKRRRWFS
jgi:hypothetical protein